MTSWQHCGCPQPRSQEQHANVADWYVPQQSAAPLYDLHEQFKLDCHGDSLLGIPLPISRHISYEDAVVLGDSSLQQNL